jgi:chemotaxis protein methyltransferase WspC
MDGIAHLLKESLGLDVSSIGRPAVERAVTSRMSACAVADIAEYRAFVQTSRTELQALIEAVVVPETWFFRDREAFSVLARAAVDERGARGGQVIRILSVPSSTGEEPYSIAMALLDAGLAADAFRVDAIDVSAEVLARATRARYGRNSFRGRDLDYRDRHFHPVDGEHQIAEQVRSQVIFRQGNLFSLDILVGETTYDAIFCRNLMIYFDRATQDRAVRTLERRLVPNGLLFVAPSEAGIVLNHPFTPLKVRLAFAFRKGELGKRPRAQRPELSAVRRLRVAPPLLASRASARPVDSGAVSTEAADTLLDEAARLANEGHIAEAAARCELHLRRHAPSVRAFYLLGMMRDAAGSPAEAAAWYRKALYLDPHHHEVLMHLALVVEQLGEHAEGRRLRERAARSKPAASGRQHGGH